MKTVCTLFRIFLANETSFPLLETSVWTWIYIGIGEKSLRAENIDLILILEYI